MNHLDGLKWPGYLFGLVVGIVLVLAIFPPDMLLNGVVPDARLWGDVAAHVIAQRAFFQDSWHWPLLKTTLLDYPAGMNVALADANPLVALPLKLFRKYLPPGFSAVQLWLAFAYLAQPVAAVFALRSAGETRFVPAAGVALLAASLPTFLFRNIHSALSSHFLILLAFGTYFRTQHRFRGRSALPVILLPISFLIHPYLAFMVFSVLLAAPVSLVFTDSRRALWATLPLAIGLMATLLIAQGLGYQDATPPAGFGENGMDILSPVDPAFSWFFGNGLPGLKSLGTQNEGFNYLGFGLITLLAAASGACLASIRRLAFLQRHIGLFLACACLTALAISSSVHFNTHLLATFGPTPDALNEIRMSGRMFWPVAYLGIIGSVALLVRLLPVRVAYALIIGAALLQVADIQPLRAGVHATLRHNIIEPIDQTRLAALLDAHPRMTMLPTFGCGANVLVPEFSQLLLAASRRGVAVNTMYVARFKSLPNCADAEAASQPLGVNELRVFLPIEAQAGPASVPDGMDLCRKLDTIAVCTRRVDLTGGLPPPGVPVEPFGRILKTSDGGAVGILGAGWYSTEPPGVWSIGREAFIALSTGNPGSDVLFVGTAIGFAGSGRVQHVTFSANGHELTSWALPGAPTQLQAIIPRADFGSGPLLLKFQISTPARPSDSGSPADTRQLGMFLSSVELKPMGDQNAAGGGPIPK